MGTRRLPVMQRARRSCLLFHRQARRVHTKAPTANAGAPEPGGGISTAFLALPIMLTSGLGVWQVCRYFWKVELMAEREKRFLQQPLDLDNMEPVKRERDAKELASCRVEVQVAPDPGRFAFIGPRGPPAGTKGGSNAATTTTGFLVLQPCTTPSGRRMLVNRGWVPRDLKENGEVAATLAPHPLVCGVVKVSDQPNSLVADMIKTSEDPESVFIKDYMWRDVIGIAKHFGTEPLCIDVVAEDGTDRRDTKEMFLPNGTIVPIVPNLEQYMAVRVTPLTHAQYATTWVTLTIAMSVIAVRTRKGLTKNLFRGK